VADGLKTETIQDELPVEKFSYETLNGWLVTCGVCLFFIVLIYKRLTKGNWE
jgi:hypothetical protein